MHALSFFMVSATPQMRWLENAIENSGSSSQHYGWPSTGMNHDQQA
jgi:hypothetical protein